MAAKESTTKTTTVAVETATDNVAVDTSSKKTVKNTKAKTTKAKAVKEEIKTVVENSEPLKNEDEIEVVSLTPNVSYKDNKTGDFYEWDEIGHVETMTFEVLKDMWRNHKKYFRNMWLKPNDSRVIKQFGLTKTYENYEDLMNKDFYVRENISKISDLLDNVPNGVKFTICNMIKTQISDGNISDAKVIRVLEGCLNVDLFSSL